ncbi:hypothetical protein EV646_103302 [Kribbella antiqua]|uniref:Uncharacterized protein n=1 Tax=Kribbella antiqua TaxID=2512217 RepID=A0A4R2IVB4_9ACTN|nr:hypothetical protein [Kribbella antiqua]TCO49324.1 hypothetical protein EV646_103302 [Kribbella antiqua]
MIPLGFEIGLTDIATLAGFLFFGSLAIGLPATVTLAVIGYRRDLNRPLWNAFRYWLLGNALTIPAMGGLAIFLHLGMFAFPLAWAPALILAWHLNREDRAKVAPHGRPNPWIRPDDSGAGAQPPYAGSPQQPDYVQTGIAGGWLGPGWVQPDAADVRRNTAQPGWAEPAWDELTEAQPSWVLPIRPAHRPGRG